MQGLVHVLLRHGDIIFETARDRLIHFMDHAKRRITVLDGLYQNADRKQIVDLIDVFILIDHLFINTEKVLCPAVHMRGDPGIVHVLLHLCHDTSDKIISCALAQRNLLHQLIIDFRLQILQRQVIQLDFHLGDTEPLCDRGINIHRLARLLDLLFPRHVFQRTHIVKTVGKLDQNDPDILCHRQKHFSQILRLNLHLIRRVGQLTQLRHAIYQESNLLVELSGQILQGHPGILHRVVEQSGDDRLLIQLQVRQNTGNTERVDDIWLPGFTLLVLMCFTGNLICFVDHGEICGRMILLHTGDQFLIQGLRACEILRRHNARIRSADIVQLFLCDLRPIFCRRLFFHLLCHVFTCLSLMQTSESSVYPVRVYDGCANADLSISVFLFPFVANYRSDIVILQLFSSF